MLFRIETENLILNVENSDKAKDVLDFYIHNQDLFDCYEPTRPDNFYTEAFHKATLLAEYNDILHSRFLRYYIYLKSNPNKIIGAVNFSNMLYGPFMRTSIGYKLDKDYHKHGYAYEACTAAIDVVFKEYHLYRIEAKVLPTNEASIRLLNRLAFRYEGLEYSAVSIKGVREDLYRYSLTQSL